LSQFVTQENLSAISGPPLPLTFQKWRYLWMTLYITDMDVLL
jgi:hypothetical protein